VIPTRGDAPHLRSALASVFLQGPDVEALIAHGVDAPLPKALLEDTRVIAVPAASGTPGARRNAALAVARAPLVAFLDDDDLWSAGHLSKSAAELGSDPSLVAVATDAWLFDDHSADGSGEPPVDLAPLPRFLGPGPVIEPTPRDLLLRNVVLTPTVVARREPLVAAGGFDGSLPAMEDWDLWLRLARRGRIRVVREPRVIVRRRLRSASRDLRAMASCALDVAGRAMAAETLLTGHERRELFGRLWHDLAYACLRVDDAPGARYAARHAITLLPGRIKNYLYWIAGVAPSVLRHRAFGAERPIIRP